VTLFEAGRLGTFLLNILLNNGLCLLGAALGLFVAQRLLAAF